MPSAAADALMQDLEYQYPLEHPTRAGHFPGHPLIPGALLIDRVILAAGIGASAGVKHAKFLRPVQPGDTILIRWDTLADGDIKFQILLGASREIAVTGLLNAFS